MSEFKNNIPPGQALLVPNPMNIIDAHHHYWDPISNYHPWLRDEPMIEFRYGDYSSIRKPFMPADYAACSGNWNIVATVTMEGEWNPADPLGEARWIQQLHDDTGKPAAHVAQAWLDRTDLRVELDAFQSLPIVRSVRHKPRANPASGGPAGGMLDKAFQDGFKLLGDYGLMFDLQTPWWHLHEAIELAQAAPDVPIILNHSGLPSDRSKAGLDAWQRAVAAFAELPQALVKISGIGVAGKPWLVSDNIDIIRFCIDAFGSDRAMFASNFPVDGLCASFDTIYSGYMESVDGYPIAVQEDLFWRTAARVYRIDSVTEDG